MVEAKTLAEAIILKANENGRLLTNMQLLKLIYYTQGLCLALHDEPACPGVIRAWSHGPVHLEVYYEYNCFGSGPVVLPANKSLLDNLPHELRSIVDYVVEKFSHIGGWALSQRTHQERPWLSHLGPDGKPDNGEITHEELKEFFVAQLANFQDEHFAKVMDACEKSDGELVYMPDDVCNPEQFEAWVRSL